MVVFVERIVFVGFYALVVEIMYVFTLLERETAVIVYPNTAHLWSM